MRLCVVGIALAIGIQLAFAARCTAGPEETVQMADQTLREIMAIPANRIPEGMLTSAQGVAVIPNVIKVGFIGGIRRGQGVVMVRDAEGEWTVPQFVTLTGGSVGWQAGIQATDVILVFLTKKSVQGLLTGKFTVGADAAVAAGPVGRNAAAATDARLQAEILSWSRSRGIFAGVSLDGSMIEISPESHLAYYGTPANQLPAYVPASAVQLLQDLATMSHAPLAPNGAPQAGIAPPVNQLDTQRVALLHNSALLARLLDDRWRQYLALPAETMTGNPPPQIADLRALIERFDRTAAAPEYQPLAQRPEFQATQETLRDYTASLATAMGGQLALPPPPAFGTAAPVAR